MITLIAHFFYCITMLILFKEAKKHVVNCKFKYIKIKFCITVNVLNFKNNKIKINWK